MKELKYPLYKLDSKLPTVLGKQRDPLIASDSFL